MIPFIVQTKDYALYHQNPMARYVHMVSTALIFFASLILLGFVQIIIPGLLTINLADVFVFILFIYYVRLNWGLALALAPIFIIFLWVAHLFSFAGPLPFSLWSFLVIFLLGVILQITGHMIEGKRPSFITNLWQILLAPLFLIAEAFFLAGRMDNLRTVLHDQDYKYDMAANKTEID